VRRHPEHSHDLRLELGMATQWGRSDVQHTFPDLVTAIGAGAAAALENRLDLGGRGVRQQRAHPRAA
jgi:hypothetical protein